MIRLSHLARRFGAIEAVNDLSLTIGPGEIFGFLGPNGAGKTTTIKMIAGLLRPSAGEIIINGHDLFQHSLRAKQQIGYIPDRPYLYEKLTPAEYLRFVGSLWHMPPAEVEQRIDHYLSLLRLSDRRDELIEGLSHGMRQKLTISAAFLHSPNVIIVDEPMVGLDPLGIRTIKEMFVQHAQNGGAVFLSTHDLQVAGEICHRVGIINNGKLIALGSMVELQQLASSGELGLEDLFLRLVEEATSTRQEQQ